MLFEGVPLDVNLLVAALAVLVAGIARGFSGFGGALIMAPTLTLIYGPTQAVPIVIILNVIVNAQLMPSAVADISWRHVAPVTVAACLSMPLGVSALVSLDPEVMRRAIGATVLAFAMLLGAYWSAPGRVETLLGFLRRVPSSVMSIVVGGIGGILNGAASVGGPPITLYLLASGSRAKGKRANIVLVFAVLHVVTVAAFWIGGLLDRTTLLLSLLLAPPFLVGSWVGTKLFTRTTDKLFNYAALVFLAAIGIGALVF